MNLNLKIAWFDFSVKFLWAGNFSWNIWELGISPDFWVVIGATKMPRPQKKVKKKGKIKVKNFSDVFSSLNSCPPGKKKKL